MPAYRPMPARYSGSAYHLCGEVDTGRLRGAPGPVFGIIGRRAMTPIRLLKCCSSRFFVCWRNTRRRSSLLCVPTVALGAALAVPAFRSLAGRVRMLAGSAVAVEQNDAGVPLRVTREASPAIVCPQPPVFSFQLAMVYPCCRRHCRVIMPAHLVGQTRDTTCVEPCLN